MNRTDKMKSFLTSLNESVKSPEQKKLISSIMEAFSLVESNPYIFAGKQPEGVKKRAMGKQSASQSKEEIDDSNKKRERREKLARQSSGRLQGVKTQLLKAAEISPMEIEEFLKSGELRNAIKAGKADLDRQFGTDTSKKSLKDRLKGAVRGFTEAEDGKMYTVEIKETSPMTYDAAVKASDFLDNRVEESTPEAAIREAETLLDGLFGDDKYEYIGDYFTIEAVPVE